MSNYNSDKIIILKGLDSVRKRPGMYIGSTDINGLHHLVWEIFDNAVDEALAGFASKIKLTLKKDLSIIIEDNGRGIPVDKHKDGKSGVETIFTELHSGGKFNTDIYKTSGGLHGVGGSVVNALSSKLIATIYRNKKEYLTIFENGDSIIERTHKIGKTSKQGTRIQFWPDYKIFKYSQFSYEIISERLRESSFLLSEIKIIIKDEINQKKDEFKYNNGIKSFVEFINLNKIKISEVLLFNKRTSDMKVQIGMQYTDSNSETIISFVNNIKTKEGGTHETAFKNMLTKIINDFGREKGYIKSRDYNFEGSDVREGLTAIISVKIPETFLEFSGQTKDKLSTPEIKKLIDEVIQKDLYFWFNENKKTIEKILIKSKQSKDYRDASKKARIEFKKTKNKLNEIKILSGKLTPAQSKIPFERELFLVEGDSAGGSAKLGRNRKYQAILPLRGKIINSEKSKLLDILKNEEIGTIINVINAGIGSDFDINKAKYHKIIIMTDADTDGAHIQILLLTFFFRYMKPLINAGMVYIAQPPLFKLKYNKNKKVIQEYLWNEEELKNFILVNKNVEIQRYKGLGEMNSDQLWETTMNPETRILIKVTLDDIAIIERRVSILMGDNIESRKEWINKNVKFTLEDDFKI